MAVELHHVLGGQHGVEPAHSWELRHGGGEPGPELRRVGGGGAEDELDVRGQRRRGLEEMEDSLLLADASHEQHVGRADAVAVQGVPALGVLEDSSVDAVVNDPDAARVNREMGEHILTHLGRDGDDPVRALHGRALRPARHLVPPAELLGLPGSEGLEAVERDHERDVGERAHENPGQGHIPGMRVHDVGVHAVAGHEQIGRESLEGRRIAGLARLRWPRSVLSGLTGPGRGQPVPRRIAAHAQPRLGSLGVTEAAHFDRGPAGERAAQVLDDHARAAVDVGRVLARKHQHAQGRAPFIRRRHQRPSRHARG